MTTCWSPVKISLNQQLVVEYKVYVSRRFVVFNGPPRGAARTTSHCKGDQAYIYHNISQSLRHDCCPQAGPSRRGLVWPTSISVYSSIGLYHNMGYPKPPHLRSGQHPVCERFAIHLQYPGEVKRCILAFGKTSIKESNKGEAFLWINLPLCVNDIPHLASVSEYFKWFLQNRLQPWTK